MSALKNGGNPLNAALPPSLVPITNLALDLGLSPKKKYFDVDTYIPITYIPADKLFVDKEFQRLVIMSFVKSAKEFDGTIARPLYVFLRPNGQYAVADGQHTTILGILYTTQGGELPLPCQVIEHPKNFTEQQCIDVEAVKFGQLNKNRRNVTKIDQLRANIALKDEAALKILETLVDMGVHVENLGDNDGPEVFGYDKIMEAHDKFGLSCVRKSLHLYRKIQKDNRFKWNGIDKPLNGGFIGGLSAVYHLMEGQFIGGASKKYALTDYLENYLGNTAIKGKNSFTEHTAGVVQSILIARKIVESCNILITNKVIRKSNGDFLLVDIGEDAMSNAGLGDPSKVIRPANVEGVE